MAWFFDRSNEIDRFRMEALLDRVAVECLNRLCAKPKRVLLLPPDITRAHSGAGWMTERLFWIFSQSAEVYVMPTLGQHVPHTDEQNRWMFGGIPAARILKHDWRADAWRLGSIPSDYVTQLTSGKANWEIPIEVNRRVIEGDWDIVLNIGHVVPHEVLGFANHNKNYFIGVGGKSTICASHMAAACYGIENNLGSLVTPLRHCFNKAEREYLGKLPHAYLMVTMAYNRTGELNHTGVYCGDDIDTYLMAAEQSREENITTVPPLRKVVAVMQGDEFASTWVANKAIYRTRKAMADGGELIILAPGLQRFGEQADVDQIIRRYGYRGTPKVLEAWRKNADLQDLTHATAHLIHGSSEGRFKVTYAPGYLSKEEIESVHFGYLELQRALDMYPIDKLNNGFNTLPSGEEIYFIKTPSAGLWSTKERLS